MPTSTYDKNKKVDYTVTVAITNDSSCGSYSDQTALEKVLDKLKEGAQWSIESIAFKETANKKQACGKDVEIERIKTMNCPTVFNGHEQGSGNYKYQLDVETMGSSSTDRLWLKNIKTTIVSQKHPNPTKDCDKNYHYIKLAVKVTATASVEEDSH